MAGRHVMVEFKAPRGEQLGLTDAAQRLGVAPRELDDNYGVVKVADEPDHTLWVVRVDADVAAKISPDKAGSQVYSDPTIEPFGPPE